MLDIYIYIYSTKNCIRFFSRPAERFKTDEAGTFRQGKNKNIYSKIFVQKRYLLILPRKISYTRPKNGATTGSKNFFRKKAF